MQEIFVGIKNFVFRKILSTFFFFDCPRYPQFPLHAEFCRVGGKLAYQKYLKNKKIPFSI